MESLSKLIYFLIVCSNFKIIKAEENNSLTSVLEEKIQNKLSEFSNYLAKYLEEFNDRHLGNSEIGRIIHYNDLKPKFRVESSRRGKNMKKMGMAMIPLIFHIGATSTWMVLTSILAAKSVAIGLMLLVFKIAVSSAKVASFFTALKAKHGHHEYSWSPPMEHHGFDRSLPDSGSYYPEDWYSYNPEVSDGSSPYKTIPLYKHNEASYEDAEYSADDSPHS